MPDCTSITVAQAFRDFISCFGIVDEVLHDLRTDSASELFTLMLKFYGIDQLKCSVLDPQSNSACERTHRIIKNMLSTYVIELKGEQDEALLHVLFAYREIPNQDFEFSTAELVFGRQLKGVLSVVYNNWTNDISDKVTSPNVIDYFLNLQDRLEKALQVAHEAQKESQTKSKTYYDSKARIQKYEPGDSVLVLRTIPSKPIEAKYTGPYRIIKQIGPVDYLVHFEGHKKDKRIIHANLLQKYNVRTEYIGKLGIVCDEIDSNECGPSLFNMPNVINQNVLLNEKLSHLSNDEKLLMKKLLQKFDDVVNDMPDCAHDLVYSIKLKENVEPKRLPAYRMVPGQSEKLWVELDKLLADGIALVITMHFSSKARGHCA